MKTDAAAGLCQVRRALISVHDKRGVAAFAAALHDLGVAVVSTGSTAETIAATGIPVTEVAAVTGFPESLDGRVKTLHPRIHAAILADRARPDHLAELRALGIEPIDLVAVNFYPFHQTVTAGATDGEVIEMIDVGGPALVRAAAKNHASVGAVVDPADYPALVEELRREGGLSGATRSRLAARAFQHTAAYEAAIAAWFQRDEPFPDQLTTVHRRVQVLRYGENPHQRAAYYADADVAWGLASAVQHQGKALSYNNLLDADAAWGLVTEVGQPCVAIIKHTNPAGAAMAEELHVAYEGALAGDPVSAFGGIVAANRPVDPLTARRMIQVFTEVVLAPGFEPTALEVLRTKPNLRVLQMRGSGPPLEVTQRVLRSVQGGLLAQDPDPTPEPVDDWKVVAGEADAATLVDLAFAWLVCKHVKSNAIVLVRDGQVVGVGAGQMSRVDAVRLAIEKSQGRANGSVLASDAFFPFRDGADAAAAAGIRAIVQPGGSVRDNEVVAAAEEHGVVMVLTGRRHFRH